VVRLLSTYCLTSHATKNPETITNECAALCSLSHAGCCIPCMLLQTVHEKGTPQTSSTIKQAHNALLHSHLLLNLFIFVYLQRCPHLSIRTLRLETTKTRLRHGVCPPPRWATTKPTAARSTQAQSQQTRTNDIFQSGQSPCGYASGYSQGCIPKPNFP
jgi:hypothetical protein